MMRVMARTRGAVAAHGGGFRDVVARAEIAMSSAGECEMLWRRESSANGQHAVFDILPKTNVPNLNILIAVFAHTLLK